MITGINSGLGFEAMRVLAKRGAHVVGAARTIKKAKEARNSVEGKTTPMACELSDMNSIKSCAESIKALHTPVDVLICNAGIMALPELKVKDGLELQFLINHMGHFLLTWLLQDRLKEADAGRIVMLSSSAHQLTVKGGIINTNLARDVKDVIGAVLSVPILAKAVSFVAGKSIPEGASTECFVATHPSLEGVGGRYFADNAEAKSSKYGRDKRLADELWDYSVAYLEPYLSQA